LDALEAGLVEAAVVYGERKGLGYAAWRESGWRHRPARGRHLPERDDLRKAAFRIEIANCRNRALSGVDRRGRCALEGARAPLIMARGSM
jgi:hypothetical protein